MKITFQNQDINNDIQYMNAGVRKSEHLAGNYRNTSDYINQGAGVSGVKNGIRLDMGNSGRDSFSDAFGGKNGKSITELQMELGAYDDGVAKDYRAVMSNTLSSEDYAKAEKEGFRYSSMDPEDVVTIQDKVKAELAMSGVIIAGYNDDMNGDVLAEAVGSDTLAREIKSEYTSNNIPLTKDNIENLKKAWNVAESLKKPEDINIAYMIENEMKPTVWNFFLSENNGAAAGGINGGIAYSGNAYGNNAYGNGTNGADAGFDFADNKNDTIVRQIEDVISKAGMAEDNAAHEQALSDAKWLLDHNLPVTVESIKNLQNIKSVEFPVSAENFAKAAMAAVSSGTDPVYADLTVTESVYAIAAKYEAEYFSSDMWENTAGDITSRRQLEEVRLSMTAEVNVKLIQSGFSIDTAPMEKLIDALKVAERQVAGRYFDKYTESDEDAVNSYRLMNETNKAIKELPSAPASVLGMFSSRALKEVTLDNLYSESRIARDTYVKAGESYEALMTAPRADLGDRISKAFSGLDSLLNSLGIEASERNLRATRILGYNGMEVTPENIERIVQADDTVQSVIRKMTPASVLKMIRDGVNPLENNFESLSEYFNGSDNDSYGEDYRDYSEFLYGLDMQDSITAEERESYIGIYRMLHQIEKQSGAVIGSVVNEQAELDFKNLISAARSNRFKGINVAIDDNFGGTADIIRGAKSITDQIASAYKTARQSEELSQLRESAETDAEVTRLLEHYDVPASAENMNAMESLISLDNNLFEDILKLEKKYDRNVKNNNISDNRNSAVDNSDDENIGAQSILSDAQDIFENDVNATELIDRLDNVVKNMTLEADSYVDVRALSLIHLQLGMMRSINSGVNGENISEYVVPYDTGDGIGKAFISFRSSENDGPAKIDIKAQSADFTAEVHMSLNGDRLEGYFVGNNASELKKMESISDIFVEALKNSSENSEVLSGINVGKLPVLAREGEGSHNRLIDNDYLSKDAEGLHSEGTEKRVLLQITNVFLQSVRRA